MDMEFIVRCLIAFFALGVIWVVKHGAETVQTSTSGYSDSGGAPILPAPNVAPAAVPEKSDGGDWIVGLMVILLMVGAIWFVASRSQRQPLIEKALIEQGVETQLRAGGISMISRGCQPNGEVGHAQGDNLLVYQDEICFLTIFTERGGEVTAYLKTPIIDIGPGQIDFDRGPGSYVIMYDKKEGMQFKSYEIDHDKPIRFYSDKVKKDIDIAIEKTKPYAPKID